MTQRVAGWVGVALAISAVVGCSGLSPARHKTDDETRVALRRCEERLELDEVLFGRALADDSTPDLQRVAARAVGRIQDERGLALLGEHLDLGLADPQLGAEMAFALGQLGSTHGYRMLDRLLHESTDPWVRRRSAEALGKLRKGADLEALGASEVGPRLASLLDDGDPGVRGFAAIGLWRRGETEQVAALVAALARETDARARWRIVYALARLDDPATLAALRPLLFDDDPRVSGFAARGLRTPVDPDPAAVDALAGMLARPNAHWTARCEAVETLGAIAKTVSEAERERIRDVLFEQLFREPNALVAEKVAGALGGAGGEIVENLLLALARASTSHTVRRAAVEHYGVVAGERAVEFLAAFTGATDPWLRAAAARGLRTGGSHAQAALLTFLADRASQAREAAARSLAAVADDAGWSELARLAVEDPAVAVRLAAVEALREHARAGWADTLTHAFRNSAAPEYWELRTEVLRALASENLGSALAREALADPFVSVRRVAASILDERGEATVFEAAAPLAMGEWDFLAPELASAAPNPHLLVETEHGAFVIELFVRDAPRHVASVLALVRAKFYDGLTIHRVVPAFVVQGGDPGGDGAGDAGYFLPDEINPRPFERGAVGMPKTGQRDTGGCQFFITHVPTPHLDGRYTVFGHVTAGMSVVDRLEVGDRLISVRVVEDGIE